MDFNHQRYPALLCFILFSAGILAGWKGDKFAILFVFLVFSAILIILRIFPYIILFLLGILFISVEKYRLSVVDKNEFIHKKVMIRGKIVDEKFVKTELIHTASKIYRVKTKFFIKTNLPCGRIVATGRVYFPEGRFKTYLISNRAIGVFKPFLMRPQGKCGLKDKIRNVLRESAWNPEHFEVMRALVLAERKGVQESVLNLFRQTGTMHVLALSGLHVGIIAIILTALFTLMRVPERFSLIATLIFLTGYLFMIGMKSSLFRAYIFFMSLIVARLLYRKIDYLNVWGFAGLISLAFNPLWIFNVGFQFSYIATLGIILSIQPSVKGFRGYVLNALISSSAATLFVSPLQIYYFKIFTPVAIVANMVAIPLVFVILSEVFLGVMFSLAGIHFIGEAFFNTGNLAILLLMKFLKLVGLIPMSYAYSESPLSGLQTVVFVAFLTVLFAGLRILVPDVEKP